MTKHKIAVILAGAAAATLLFCVLTGRWFQYEDWSGKATIGLRGIEWCMAGSCESRSLDVFAEEAGTFVKAATITFVLGLVSVALLAAAGVLGYRRHARAMSVAKIALLVLVVTVMAALVVMVKRPQVANASLGVFLFMAGGMAGVVAAQMLASQSTYDEQERDPSIPRL